MTDTGKAFVPESQDDADASKEVRQYYTGGAKHVLAASEYGDYPENQVQNFTEASALGVLWNGKYRNLELNAMDGFHHGQFTVSGLAGSSFNVFPEYASGTELVADVQALIVFDLLTNAFISAVNLPNGTYAFRRFDCSTINFVNDVNTDTVVLEGMVSKA